MQLLVYYTMIKWIKEHLPRWLDLSHDIPWRKHETKHSEERVGADRQERS